MSDLDVNGGRVYLGLGDMGVEIVDATDPTQLAQLKHISTQPAPSPHVGDPLPAAAIRIAGKTLYAGDTSHEVQILDVTVPTDPFWVGHLPVPAAAIVVDGDTVYSAADEFDASQICR